MPVPCLTTALTGPLKDLETRILSAPPQIAHWFRSQWPQYTPPFCGSADFRNSGFKLGHTPNYLLSNSFAFGGSNASLVLAQG